MDDDGNVPFDEQLDPAIADAYWEAVFEVVRQACAVVDADTYKHPMLSRQEAIMAGVMGLHTAVTRYRSLSPHEAMVSALPVPVSPE